MLLNAGVQFFVTGICNSMELLLRRTLVRSVMLCSMGI